MLPDINLTLAVNVFDFESLQHYNDRYLDQENILCIGQHCEVMSQV